MDTNANEQMHKPTSSINLPRLILAAPMSGSGKTIITAGIIAALVQRGHTVAPFKCGPDYIDPSYHTLAAGRPCTNLDAWLTPTEFIPTQLYQRAQGADIALIEGVMGLFDGHISNGTESAEADSGSTAHIARLTHTPIIIVLDARGMARTAAALLWGLKHFDPRLNIAGVILNRVGSERHAKVITDAIHSSINIPVLGYLPRQANLTLPERHLGLIPTNEAGDWQNWLQHTSDQVEAYINLDHLLTLAQSAPPLTLTKLPTPTYPTPQEPRPTIAPTIAVARDAAFSFHYEDNLDLLRAAGANIAFFSPLTDTSLPANTSAIYLCGGFPELYADQLSNNHAMLTAINNAAAQGLPIYAECGGLIYLTQSITTLDGQRYPLAGLLPGHAKMTPRVTLGYRQVRALADSWLWRAGESSRGHEFHYSVWEDDSDNSSSLYEITPTTFIPQPTYQGKQQGNILASYIHLHFLAKPELASRFVKAASNAANALSITSHS